MIHRRVKVKLRHNKKKGWYIIFIKFPNNLYFENVIDAMYHFESFAYRKYKNYYYEIVK